MLTRNFAFGEELKTRRTVADVVAASHLEELRDTRPSSRTLAFVASTDERDSYGDRITVDGHLGSRRFGRGWKLERFKKNPVFMAFHDYHALPIGTVTRIWQDLSNARKKKLRIAVEFVRPEENPMAETFFSAFRGKSLRGVSVGFRPITSYEPKNETERRQLDLGKGGSVFGEQELWEVSAVPIPANPSSLMESACPDRKCLMKFAERVGSVDSELGYRMRSALGLNPRRKTFDLGIDVTAARQREQIAQAGDKLEESMRRLMRTTEKAASEAIVRR